VGVAYEHPISITQEGTVTALDGNAEQLGVVLRRVADELPDTTLVVAAHGVATTDDDQREHLLRETLDEIERARGDGVELAGYFHDTGIDGYDWVDGFDQPRGLAARDRAIKPSGRFLQSTLS
jgi:beta-glucosidase